MGTFIKGLEHQSALFRSPMAASVCLQSPVLAVLPAAPAVLLAKATCWAVLRRVHAAAGHPPLYPYIQRLGWPTREQQGHLGGDRGAAICIPLPHLRDNNTEETRGATTSQLLGGCIICCSCTLRAAQAQALVQLD